MGKEGLNRYDGRGQFLMDFRQALAKTMAAHPLMAADDFLKFAYQAAYGSEHAIVSPADARTYFHEEWRSTPKRQEPLYEDLGNGYVRVALGAWKREAYPPRVLFRLFLAAKPSENGAVLAAHYLDLIGEAVASQASSLTAAGWAEARADYEAQGGGPVSHSDVYRRAYQPHYRVVLKRALLAYLRSRPRGRPPKRTPSLRTERLLLRPFRKQDAKAVYAWSRSLNVTAFLSWPPHRSLAQSERIVASWVKKKRNYAWALVRAGKAIGEVEVIKDLPGKGAEMGYLLGEAFWGQGYLREALAAILPFLWHRGGYRYLECEVAAGNAPSLALLRRFGFKDVGTATVAWPRKKQTQKVVILRLGLPSPNDAPSDASSKVVETL